MDEVPGYRVTLDIEGTLTQIRSVLEGGWLTAGHQCEELEQEWGRLTGLPHVICTSSGERALDLALEALLARRGNQRGYVVLSGIGFIGDSSAIMRAGCVPLYVDVDQNMQLDVDALWQVASSVYADEVVGVLPVHIGGHITDRMEEIEAICRRRHWLLLEDACHAHGARSRDRHAGAWGHAAVLSFYATKVVTCGEGGAVLTRYDDVARYVSLARGHGLDSVYDTSPRILASNSRMSDLSAAVAIVQTRSVQKRQQGRARIAERYDDVIERMPGWRFLDVPGCSPSWYKYVVFAPSPSRKQSLVTPNSLRSYR